MPISILLDFQNSSFFRKNFVEILMLNDDPSEFPGGQPHWKIFKNLSLPEIDPGLLDEFDRSNMIKVVDHLAFGQARHAHVQRKKSEIHRTRNNI